MIKYISLMLMTCAMNYCRVFCKELEKCEDAPEKVASVFVKAVSKEKLCLVKND